jgi:hypothetical protein
MGRVRLRPDNIRVRVAARGTDNILLMKAKCLYHSKSFEAERFYPRCCSCISGSRKNRIVKRVPSDSVPSDSANVECAESGEFLDEFEKLDSGVHRHSPAPPKALPFLVSERKILSCRPLRTAASGLLL